MRALGAVATELGKGSMAGMVGTAAITIASTLEKKVRGRPASDAPAGSDLVNHAVYAAATDTAYRWLSRSQGKPGAH
ncbi:MAG: hypothetical protein KA712_09420 [Myxococcales bacterium]|nr:hypothetical protein [Myxococcales bacterium]